MTHTYTHKNGLIKHGWMNGQIDGGEIGWMDRLI